MLAVISDVLHGQNSQLDVLEVYYDSFNISIYFTSPGDLSLVDSFDFQETLNQINLKINTLLDDEGYPSPHNVGYELFINGNPLVTGFVNENKNNKLSATSGALVAISPGHGYAEWIKYNNEFRLDRGYHNGIVEDFINLELVTQLHENLTNSGIQVYSVRELDKNSGIHSSGHPMWEMGASEYARSLGYSSFVWGQNFTQGKDRNVVAPPELANAVGANILVSIHNNGGGGTGTETWYDTVNGYANESQKLADLIQGKIIERLRLEWNPNWKSRGVKKSNGGYGENRRFDGPSVIVELAFMDNPSDNAALQDPRFQSIAMQAINDAIMEYLNAIPSSSVPIQFQGNPSSRLFLSDNGKSLNLEVCADNLPGQTIYTRLSRPGKMYEILSTNPTERCLTFWGLTNNFFNEEIINGVAYTVKTSLNQPPNDGWTVPCYSATGGRGLCDTIVISGQSPGEIPNTFLNGTTSSSINNSEVGLQVCADDLQGKVVYIQMWRDATHSYPANTWDYSKVATNTCISFSDIDGTGPTFENTDYYLVASIEPIGTMEASQMQISCYETSGHTRLCDKVRRSVTTNIFNNGASNLTINNDEVNLQVCGDSISGKRVYIQMWRDSANGYPAFTWNKSQIASTGCVIFSDIDGAGGTFENVDYFTVAALEPIGSAEAAQMQTSCYETSGHTRLCDTISRGGTTNIFSNGSSSLTINLDAINLQVCGDNIAGKPVYIQMWRDAANGYPANTWNKIQVAGSNCTTFYDIDGAGGTFLGVNYYTVAALEPLGSSEAAQKRTACYTTSGHTRLCDMTYR